MTSNNLGSIYATTISSEKYIIIDSQNIELSGNVIISNSSIITNSIIPNITNNESLGTSSKIWSNAYIHDVSINNNIEISGNTIINGVLQVSGNATISGSTLYVPSSFTIDPNGHGDNTGTLLINGNLIVQGETTTINSSVVDISDKMIILASNASNSFEANGAGFEISGAKVKFLYDNTSTTFNSSIGMSISGNVVPVTNSVGSLGESGKIWDIAYIRELNVTNFTNSIDGAKIANETITSTQIMNGSILTADICDNAITFDKLAYNSVGNTRIINAAVTHEKLSSNCVQSHNIVDGTIVDGDISANANILGSKLANNSITSDKINQANNWTFSQLTTTRANIRDVSATNIEVSGNIVPLRDISSNLGSSLNRWNYIYVNDLSVNTINGTAYSAGGGASDSSINRVISISDNKITTATRVYQEISNNSNWNAVNGYYGLAKQSFPALNPLSSGAKAIAYWTSRQSGGNADFKSIIWAPKLRMFLTFPDLITPTNNIFAKYSYDGINWINISISVAVYIKCICWSEELGIFVAGSFRHPFAIYSYNGIEWFTNTTRDSDISFFSICWSPELGIFVAVTDNINSTYKACTSNDGINWIGATTTANQAIKWGSVCWAPELGLFVATNNEYNNTNTKVMTSNDGYNWTLRTVPTAAEYPNWGSVCWSPQLGIFVTVAWNMGGPTANIMTSTNGIDWIIRKYNDGSNPAYRSVCWCAELGIFLITQTTGGGSYLYSRNGTDWIEYENISENGEYISFNAQGVCWSPELGIFVAVGGTNIWTSVLKGRIPTISNVFDSSFNKIDENGKWTFSAIDVSGALNVMGAVSAPNLYTKTEVDISFVSKEIFDASLSSIQLTNVYTKTQVDVSFVSKELFDASINALASGGGGGGGGGSTDLTSITSNVVPATTNTYNLGSTTNYWSNAYINNLKVSNRVYQEISGDISWSAVNGHYGLAKDAYPGLNPLSSGDKAVQTWTGRTSSNDTTNQWIGVCWSPQLGLFVAIANFGSNKLMTSPNGINWTGTASTNEGNEWWGVCWSPQLSLFVAVGYIGSIRVMTSPDGTTWTGSSASDEGSGWLGICWSPELGLFVAVAYNGPTRVMTSHNGKNWTNRPAPTNRWYSVCWSPELRLFVAVAEGGTNRVMTSRDGTTWTTDGLSSNENNSWVSVCWSSELGLFVAVAYTGSNRVMTSSNGINWTGYLSVNDNTNNWHSVCWSPQLRLFVAVAASGTNRVMTSPDGRTWTGRLSANDNTNAWHGICWSPELGIAVAVGNSGSNRVMTSSLKGRPPTSYNVFDSNFNNIDETGKWTFQNLGVTGTFTNTSDDRLKHNEIVISNGLAIIDSLTPKFYQKTLTMLDASYNGDLSTQAWTYEAGVIAQELLQISDLSFVVSGGDYYQERYIYSRPTNDPSNANYDPRFNIYDISNANYTISNTLITQTYSVNYNSVFVYGLAAIKELHQKVKAQETRMLEQQATINSLLTRLQALETSAN